MNRTPTTASPCTWAAKHNCRFSSVQQRVNLQQLEDETDVLVLTQVGEGPGVGGRWRRRGLRDVVRSAGGPVFPPILVPMSN